ncbi:MAG: hypothetical protein DRJ69_06700, partial [Thermoprotei archaeon]
MTLTLTEYIKRAYEFRGIVTAYVYGDMGTGKTSYALHVAREVYGSWEEALNHLLFDPLPALRLLEKALEEDRRIPLIILDDAGFWLSKLEWWKEETVAFMQFYNLARTVVAGIIFTTPQDDLPSALRKKVSFRISVRPLSWEEVPRHFAEKALEKREEYERQGINWKLWCMAVGYRLRTLPSFMQRVKKKYIDIYPMHYPKSILEKYEEKRKKAVRKGLERLKELLEKTRKEDKSQKKRDTRMIIQALLAEGKTPKEVSETTGIPLSTVYY